MKICTQILLFALLQIAVQTSFAQSCTGNLLTNANGYYGGFEAGSSNISATGGGTDLSYGLPRNGSYEIVSSPSQAGGGGYLSLAPHSGSWFMLIHTSSKATDRLWYKKVSVTPGLTYQFCA